MEGRELSQIMRQKTEEFKKLCEGLDERTASAAPVGRWSPKQIVSHLCGPEGGHLLSALRSFLDRETPELALQPGDPFFSDERSRMTFGELLAQFEREYNGAAAFVAGLSPQQLSRKAHIPALKESPLGEYPTLEAFIQGIAEYHIAFHLDHMREILRALGAAPRA
jgi:hypothetical protein